jgi:hypothetical protein
VLLGVCGWDSFVCFEALCAFYVYLEALALFDIYILLIKKNLLYIRLGPAEGEGLCGNIV